MTQREPKPSWSDVPEVLRARLAKLVGATITSADIVWGGYGPSATFVLTTAAGRRYFCKGTHPGQTPQGHAALLTERRNYEHYPELTQFMPVYLGATDHDNWHMAVLDYVRPTRSVPPWTDDAVGQAIDLMARFHRATPKRAANDPDLRANSQIFYGKDGWKTLIDDKTRRGCFLTLFTDEDAAARWLAGCGAHLAGLEAQAPQLGGPQSWLHLDIRSDNIVFAERPQLVDWPLLSYGASLADVVAFLPSLEGEGGPRCADALRLYEDTANVRFEQHDLTIATTTIAGFFAARAGEPEIPALPRVRWIQKLQLFPALVWMCAYVGVDPLPVPRPF